MNLIKCYQTQSTWYKETVANGTPIGILWHDTGAGNPNLKRYVQPSDDAPDRDEMLELIGVNTNGNDWNHVDRSAGLNAWIGKLADGSVATIQAADWDLHPWGCGSGDKGSCNGYIKEGSKPKYLEPFWIQFEMCDDSVKDSSGKRDYTQGDPEYFAKVYKEACEFTAYICKKFNIDPKGTYVFNGVEVPTITCHKDSHTYKLGSNHGDVIGWFDAFGKTMNDVRNDVAALLKEDNEDYLKTPEDARVFLNELIKFTKNYFNK